MERDWVESLCAIVGNDLPEDLEGGETISNEFNEFSVDGMDDDSNGCRREVASSSTYTFTRSQLHDVHAASPDLGHETFPITNAAVALVVSIQVTRAYHVQMSIHPGHNHSAS